jgi:2-furoate---CoA ligase
MDLYRIISFAAERTPDRVAVKDLGSGKQITYSDLIDKADRLAAGFSAHGVKKGDHVGTLMANSLDHLIVLLAAARLGAVGAPVNFRMKSEEVVRLALKFDFKMLCTDRTDLADQEILANGLKEVSIVVADRKSNEEHVVDLRRFYENSAPISDEPFIDEDDPAFIFFTSGTTGLPKGAVIPSRATEYRYLFMVAHGGMVYGPAYRFLCVMPMFHVIGFYANVVATLALNGTAYLTSRFVPAEILDAIESEEINCIFATPTHYHMLVHDDGFSAEKVKSLTHLLYAGAPMSTEMIRKCEKLFKPGLTHILGSTEAMNSHFYFPAAEKPQALRKGVFTNSRIVKVGGTWEDALPPGEEGEMVIDARMGSMFKEYYKNPEETTKRMRNNWFHTGDLAYQDEEGNVYVTGRVDDVIISGGENIHPAEVEDTLLSMPGVNECVVVGVPDSKWGQRLVALVRKDGKRALDEESIRDFLGRSQLASYKRPKEFVFVDSIPKNSVGKVVRKECRSLYMESGKAADL